MERLCRGERVVDPLCMDRDHELKEIEDVRDRLSERFPPLGAEVIETAVRLAHSELTGGIRDYVPVLVEHTAGEQLAAFARESQPTESAAGLGD